jgi:tRNA pseudouridine38-40 synthase
VGRASAILPRVTTVRLDIEYDGSGFRGWARQPGLRTVQGVLEAALEQVLRAPVQLTVAGRTDTGVHALGQVASFATAAPLPPDLARNLNGVTPDDIAVRRVEPVAADFDARRDARSRSYLYRVATARPVSPFERRRSLFWPHPIDRTALDACAAALLGSHDFTAFTPTQTDHVHFNRSVAAASWRDEPSPWSPEPLLSFRITADAFMRNMVRALVGTQLEVATGKRTAQDFTELLSGAPRSAAGETAPPHGLYLASVSYDRGVGAA